ncbi:Rnf-Nqr domain containing protein [Anaerotruncus colihominis]|uniref:Rnf-Nqr domain containing protein n=1 Tax=Anaerotruncus colihominis TaxID=169435 RepID=UPI0026F24D5C|nr:Rnf-Nqr domain containing protein [Anaerotruncus colihominis]
MKLERVRAVRKRSRWFDGLLTRNPVLVGGMAIPFAVVITTSLKNSVSISILLACSLIPTVLLASLVGARLPRWGAPILYTLFSLALIVACVPLILPISPEVADSLGIFVPLLSVNTLLLTLCGRCAGSRSKPLFALVDAVSYSVGFALVMCLLALLREWFGTGTVWGVLAHAPFTLGGVQMTFAGFILLALLSAAARFLRRAVLLLIYRSDNPRTAPPSA